MTKRAVFLLVLTVPFALYTAYVLMQIGYVGLVRDALSNLGSIQVFADLVIVCILGIAWMLRDAAKTGRNAWPYVILTCAAGSFGILFYLLVGEFRRAPAAAST